MNDLAYSGRYAFDPYRLFFNPKKHKYTILIHILKNDRLIHQYLWITRGPMVDNSLKCVFFIQVYMPLTAQHMDRMYRAP